VTKKQLTAPNQTLAASFTDRQYDNS